MGLLTAMLHHAGFAIGQMGSEHDVRVGNDAIQGRWHHVFGQRLGVREQAGHVCGGITVRIHASLSYYYKIGFNGQK